MPIVNKEVLIDTLEKAVNGAHQKNPGALGVVLFGSQARGTPRPDSDVDLLYIIGTPFDVKASFVLSDELDAELAKIGLPRHYSGSISLKTINGILDGTVNQHQLSVVQGKRMLLGGNRIIITTKSQINDTLNRII